MGDWLRRLLYPLVLPTIVATVWLCGWVRQQEDRMGRDRWSFPPLVQALTAPTFPDADPSPAPVVPQRPGAGHAFFATASAEDADEDE